MNTEMQINLLSQNVMIYRNTVPVYKNYIICIASSDEVALIYLLLNKTHMHEYICVCVFH